MLLLRLQIVLFSGLLFVAGGRVLAAEAPSEAPAAMRLLKSNCFSCHNSEKKKGGFVMTSREALLKGGDDGAAVVEGKPEKSGLIDSLSADADPHMPPKKQLTPAQIEVLNEWVKNGAVWDAAALKDQPSAPRRVALTALPATYHPVLALALSPDHQRLAAGCGNEVVICDLSGKEPVVLARAGVHPDPVQSIAWSADGKQLATGAFRRLVIWTVDGLHPERQITQGLTDRISAIRFLPPTGQCIMADGRIAENGMVRIIDPATGTITGSWLAHADTIFDLAVSPDGKLLATAGGDKLVKIWDLATHKELAKLEGHVAQVLAVAFSDDAGQLVSGGADRELKVWDVKTKEKIMSLGAHAAAISGVAWITSGPAVLAIENSGDVLRYVDLKAHDGVRSASPSATERKVASAEDTAYCLAASPDGERIFAGTHGGCLLVWNKDGKRLGKLDLAPAPVTASNTPSTP